MTNTQVSNEASDAMLPSEAAGAIHVTTKTLQRMADRGEIRAIRLPSGHRRYNRDDIERIRSSQDEPAEVPATSA